MTESQKTDPPVKSKEKNSLLADIDIDKDFLGSWKSISMGDDGMDFDFGPTTKGIWISLLMLTLTSYHLLRWTCLVLIYHLLQRNLENQRKVQKKYLVVEPIEQKETALHSHMILMSSQIWVLSRKRQIDDNTNKSKDKEGYSNASSSGGSGDFLAKDVDASEDDDISLKHPASRGVTNSEVDTQTDNIKDPDPINEDDNLKSFIDESSLLKPANSEEQETHRTIEHLQESPSSEKRYSPEPLAQKVVQDPHVRSEDSNVSADATYSDVQEEEFGTLVRMVSLSTGDEQNDNVRPVAELLPTRIFSAHMKAQTEKGEMCKMRDDNVIAERIDDSDTSKADLHLENYVTPGIENLAHEDMADKRNADSFSKLQGDLLGSGTTIDGLASDKERGNIPILSKYFKKQNGSEPVLQQASASSTKQITIGNKRTNTLPSNPASEKSEFSRSLESGSKFTGSLRSLPKMLSGDIPVQTENTEASHVKSLDNTRECLNADNMTPRNEPTVTTMAHEEASASSTKLISIGNKRTDTLPSNPALQKRECLNADNIRSRNERMVTTTAHDIMKEKPVSKGSDQNTEHINAHRSDVHPSTSIEKLRTNISLNIINPGTSTHNMRKAVVKENRISPTKAEMKASEVSTSRATEPKLKPLNSLLPKGLTSIMRNKDQNPEMQGSTVLKRNFSLDTKKQAPPTPTLKRKIFEESVDIPRLTPLKRLSASPCSNNIRASSETVVKEQGCNHMSVAHDKSPRLDVSLTEIDISSSIENDGIFEKAEACSKELEDICNMLKKKHEEANDILVRAIVNINNLLMLNHPIYQDKIRMVQKFAELLMLK